MGLRHWTKLWSRVPWEIPESDLCEANRGELELYRDLSINGRPQRQIAMHVTGSVNPHLSLGLIAVRCERRGDHLIPLTLSIPETPIVVGSRTDEDVA